MTTFEFARSRAALQRTWEVFERISSPHVRAKVEAIWDEPHVFKPRKRIDKLRFRVLPIGAERGPKDFWQKKWGFYEVTIGGAGDPFLENVSGQVQFFQAPTSCGNAQYSAAVEAILNRLPYALKDFRFVQGASPGNFLYCCKEYERNLPFTPEEAADALSRLIEATLPRFHAIADTSR